MNGLVEVIKDELNKLKKMLTQTGTDYIATVTSVEGQTAHVRIAGSDISDTPVAMSINAKAGDTVRVRVSGGRAWITGNDTAPPTDDTKAIELIENTSQGVMENAAKYSRMDQSIDEIRLEVGEKMNSDMTNRASSIAINSGQMAFNSNSIVINSSKFTLDAQGNATFSGTINAASGSFTGSISSDDTSGLYGVTIDRGQIRIYDREMTGGVAYINSAGVAGSGSRQIQSISISAPGQIQIGNAGLYVTGAFEASGTKSRVVCDTNYGDRKLYAYETATPYFGDIGIGITNEDGEALIGIDDIFDETINADVEYCVFLQKEGQGDLWIETKEHDYFVVKGTPNLRFSWEIKAVQKNYEYLRLDDRSIADDYCVDEDVGLSMEEALSALDDEELFDKVTDEELFDVA